jgi:RNA polymerase sigma factor (sigma-70 family)
LRESYPDDAALVAALRDDDRQAWRAFLDRYERLIYSVPRRMGLDAEDAADVFQDVLAAFLRGLPRLREPRTIPRWLTRTAFRLARERRMRRRREPTLPDPVDLERVVAPGDVAELFARAEDAARLRALVARSTGRCPELLGLLFFADPVPGYEVIARSLGMPIGSLGPTRQRCLDQLFKAFAAESAGARISRPARPTLKAEGAAPVQRKPRRPR